MGALCTAPPAETEDIKEGETDAQEAVDTDFSLSMGNGSTDSGAKKRSPTLAVGGDGNWGMGFGKKIRWQKGRLLGQGAYGKVPASMMTGFS